MASRLDLIKDAQRPKMSARALFQGPQGSGKTWTTLSIARELTKDVEGAKTLVIDTERESTLTYADVFTFKHLPWRSPYDPAELTHYLGQLDQQYEADDVIIIDSFSHFWSGTGGTLDIASGRVQGGWDKARPIQNSLIEQILSMRCHVLLCARMKNTVQVSDGGKTIETIGLTITQDDTLGYEMNIVLQMDMNHSATVLKSRTTAVPVGRVFPGGHEKKLADDYSEWLAGGIPPANRDDVDRIVGRFAGIVDSEARATLKQAFIARFGMPQSLPATEVPAALQWLEENGASDSPPPAGPTGADPPATDAENGDGDHAASETSPPEAPAAPVVPPEAENALHEEPPAAPVDPEPRLSAGPDADAVESQAREEVGKMESTTVMAELTRLQIPLAKKKEERAEDLIQALVIERLTAPTEQETLV